MAGLARAGSAVFCLATVCIALLAGGAAAKCTPGQDGCIQCQGGRCVKCQEFEFAYFNATEAYGLTSQGTCVKCEVSGNYGYYCKRCDGDHPSKCLECSPVPKSPIILYADQNGNCQPCNWRDVNCANCTNGAGTCIECNYGYGLQNGRCVKCLDENCSTCKGNAAVCTECTTMYTPVDGKCKRCSDDSCWACKPDNLGFCTVCSPYDAKGKNQGLNKATGKCQACADPYCNGCQNNYKFCDYCQEGYYASKGVCKKCEDPLCQSCKSNGKCAYCKDGAGFDKATGRCAPCAIKGCANCSNNKDTCQFCNDGGSVVNGKCTKCNVKNCSTCEKRNPNRCTSCSSLENQVLGLNVKTGQCVPCADPLCQSCYNDASKCDYCPQGYTVVNNASCVACADPHCDWCDSPSNCTSCSFDKKYGVDPLTGTCKKCADPTNCKQCDTTDYRRCTECKASSGLSVDANTGKCVKATLPNCAVVSKYSSRDCQRCNPGYRVAYKNEGAVCVKN